MYTPARPQTFPGYYSWWSVEPEEEPPPPMEGGEMPSINFQQQKDNFSVMTSGYIKSDLFKTDRSAFGSIKFSVDFELAVKSCVNSFANVTHGSLKACYKKAGTFCYKHKVCYIIIVCVAIRIHYRTCPQLKTPIIYNNQTTLWIYSLQDKA